MKRGPLEDIKKIFEKKSHKAEKGRSPSAKKVRTFCFGKLVKKLAHTHGFEHKPSGLKSKHLTTRPRTPELCDLRAETRVVARKKKHPHFPITLAHHKCNNSAYESIITNIRSLHLNEFGVRMHNYHSLVPSHEKRIVIDSLRNLNLTLILTAEQNI